MTWTYVEDCAEAFYRAYKTAKPRHRIFNVSGEIRPVKHTVDLMRTLFPAADIKIGTDPVNTLPYLSTDRIREELGFEPRYSMEEGIKDYVGQLSGRL